MPDSMSSSPLVAALDPRVDEQVVQEQMQNPVAPEPEPQPDPEPEIQPDPAVVPDPDDGSDNPTPDISGARP
jgi:hypothetical protein